MRNGNRISEVFCKYNITESTLSGPAPVFTAEEEKDLDNETCYFHCCEKGIPIMKTQFLGVRVIY